MNEIIISYIEDLRDSILLFNESLIAVQNGVKDKDTVNNIFRVAHTIKGNSAAMSFTKIQKVMHTMEDILAEVRNGTREFTDDLTPVLFGCHDFLEDCLEVVQAHESDASMDVDVLLGKLVALKDGSDIKAPVSAPVINAVEQTKQTKTIDPALSPKNVAQDVDLGVIMPSNLWDLLYNNIQNGLSAYKLDIDFQKNSSMKAVRAWMIFDRLEQAGIILFSKPEKLGENNFNPSVGETPFEADTIEVVLISEHEISELVEDIKTMSDIENVVARRLPKDDIKKKMEYLGQQQLIIDKIQGISVDLLGVDIQFIKDTVLEGILEKMESIASSNLLDSSSPVIITAKRLAIAINEALINKKRIPIEERENIIFLCQTIEECLIYPESMDNKNLIQLMYQKLDDFIEIVTTPERKLGDILSEKALLNNSDIHEILKMQKGDGTLKFGQIAVQEKLVRPMDIVEALASEKQEKQMPVATGLKTPAGQTDSGFVRVPVVKIDGLIDMLSELLIYNSQLEQSILQMGLVDTKTSNILSRTEKLIKEIQALSMSLRMIEVKQTFHRLTRICRDAATDLGKKVTVHLEGEDTEIDRSAVEKLFDPLMHMVRNSVSHGIEDTEEERTAVGKKPEGQVFISGYSKRGNVYIDVRDDGKGINTKKVLEKAKKQGIASDNKEYTDQEIYKFLFLPGFSTQEKVNAVAGRGVGMNVVEEAVTKLGGKVEVESELGAGSVFRIKLPINLAVVNGTIVEIAGNRYIIPTMCVKKFFIATDADWVSIQGEKKAIKVDGSIVSLVSKSKVFGLSDEITEQNMRTTTINDEGSFTNNEFKEYEMVVLEIDQKLLVMHVDKIIGRQDVVSKPLANDFASVSYANSASILGDGFVCLILDIDSIFKISQS